MEMKVIVKESNRPHQSTIEIQDHLLFCLQNTGVRLLPVLAKGPGGSSMQGEKILLLKELLLHSKSYVEQPILQKSEAAAILSQLMQVQGEEQRRSRFQDESEDHDEDEDLYDSMYDQDFEDVEEIESNSDFQEQDDDEDIHEEEQVEMAFISEPVVGASSHITIIQNQGVVTREISATGEAMEQEHQVNSPIDNQQSSFSENDQQSDPQP